MADVPAPGPDPLSYIWYLLAQVTASIGDLTYNLQTALYQNITSISAQLASVVGQVAAGIQGLLGGLASTITQVVNGVLAGIQQYLGPLLDTLSTIASQIQSFFTNILSRLETVVLGLWQEITRRVGEALQWLASIAADVKAAILAIVSSAVNGLVALYEQVKAAVVSLVTRALDSIAAVAKTITDTVAAGVKLLLTDAQRTIQDTTDLITQGWKRLVTGSEALVVQIREKLEGISTGFADAADTVADAIDKLIPEQVPKVLDAIKQAIEPLLAFTSDEYAEQTTQLIDQVFGPATLHTPTRRQAAAELQFMAGKTRIGRAVFTGIVTALTAVNLYQGIAAANAEQLKGEYSMDHPWAQLAPGDIGAAWRRGLLTDDQAIDLLRYQGYNREDAQRILALGQSPPAPTEQIALWRRGIIDEDQLDRGMAAAAVDREWVEPLIRGSEYIPPIHDLITMAVREAFTPEIAQRFGQYEDYPDTLTTWAAKQGMSADWARAYWAAHWGLPSVQMGYEMLHRGVISQSDLELLLRAQDVMPFWRDKLIAISYNPYTRVDVRRMHKLGILTDEQVKRAYLDLGYDDDHAAHLAEFTIKANAGPSEEDVGELGKLTKAAILGFYRDGIIKRERAVQLLTEAGITPEAAELFAQQVDVDEADAERKAEAGLVVELALAGEITEGQARERLNGIGLGATEVDKILAQLYRKLAAKTKIPTRSEGEQMLKAGVIQAADYKALLSSLGYTERWQTAFVQLAQGKAAGRG